ncbi:hypothetical protein GYMLUDRAFT_37703 [Collybiopsis luxurians FD-317 M1]|nr:hypothetical protein GYMLUDRAFT_37703 [Collybiopsis luxurians FD-317 M1]
MTRQYEKVGCSESFFPKFFLLTEQLPMFQSISKPQALGLICSYLFLLVLFRSVVSRPSPALYSFPSPSWVSPPSSNHIICGYSSSSKVLRFDHAARFKFHFP